MFRQYEVESTGRTRRVCWLDHEPTLSIGTVLTLKGSDEEWVVAAIHRTAITNVPDHGWQVGGIVGRMRAPR